MIKPFIRWAGGKQNLLTEILKYVPKPSSVNIYYEPFVGAGSLFFSGLYNNAYISDINKPLINAYIFIRDDYESVYHTYSYYEKKFKRDFNYYYKVRELFNKNISSLSYKQAARFIFLIHSNFNGIYRVNESGKYNVPIGKRSPALPSIEHLKTVSESLRGNSIKCMDYYCILDKVKKNDFVYLDPPYPPLDWNNHNRQFTVNKFGKLEHERLAIFAKKINEIGCYTLISNTDNDFVVGLYNEWDVVRINSVRSISCKRERKKVSELIIKNY